MQSGTNWRRNAGGTGLQFAGISDITSPLTNNTYIAQAGAPSAALHQVGTAHPLQGVDPNRTWTQALTYDQGQPQTGTAAPTPNTGQNLLAGLNNVSSLAQLLGVAAPQQQLGVQAAAQVPRGWSTTPAYSNTGMGVNPFNLKQFNLY